MSTFAYGAENSNSTNAAILINDALSQIEPYKDSFGYTNIDFESLEVGSPISAYNLYEEGPVFSRKIYPLFEGEALVLLGLEVYDGDNTYIQITQGLVDELNEITDWNTPYALIYDDTGCYLCSDEEVQLLVKSEVPNDDRSSLDTISNAALMNATHQTKIQPQSSLNYMTPATPLSATQVYYSCPVEYVGQMPYDSICWAATIACICNYVRGTDLTAAEIAQNYYDSTDPDVFNQGLYDNVVVEFMNTDYYLGYTYISTPPNDNIILRNIMNDFPLYSCFENENGGRHALTIYGINVVGGYISIMDPMNGALTATFSASALEYQYVSPSTNNVFTLLRGGYCY